ncbi:MAG TPA: alkaline phosphatase [Bryobacteraceae bacterium]|nr:alkaline phosphatase [Bryobacteraceae bacterium]
MTRFAAALALLCCLSTARAQTAGVPAEPHFAVIGVDGLSIDGVQRTRSPRLHAFMMQAAWTLEARAVMPTLSSPNWESIITASAPEQHGITSNGYLKQKIEIKPVCLDSAGKFPTIFQILRDQKPASRIAVFHDWDGFADLLEKSAPDKLEHDSGPRKTTDAALRYWNENHPDLLFVHLDNVDHAGHEYGWATKEYYSAVEEADFNIGKLLDALLATPNTYVLITSDHGGKSRGHGGNTMGEIQIPWMLAARRRHRPHHRAHQHLRFRRDDRVGLRTHHA